MMKLKSQKLSKNLELAIRYCKILCNNWVRKEVYKQVSSIGSAGSVYSISLNAYTDFVKNINLLDGKIINLSLSDTEFVSINRRTKATILNPG